MKTLKKRLKKLLKTKGVVDIVLFGSASKGKMNPADIDVAVLMQEKEADIRALVKEELPKADVQIISLKDIHNPIFFTLLKEGYSISKQNYLHNLYGIKPIKLYKYSLKQLNASKKVMFERGIKNIKGIQRLSNRVVVVPIEFTGEFDDFLKMWDLDIGSEQYELVPMMRKEIFD